MSEQPGASFIDLPRELFPVKLTAIDLKGREVWTETVAEPWTAVYIPYLAGQFGQVRMRVEYGDGSVEE